MSGRKPRQWDNVKKKIKNLIIAIKNTWYLEVMKFSVGDKDTGDFHLKYNWNSALTLNVLVKCLTMKFTAVELLGLLSSPLFFFLVFFFFL